MLMSVQQIDYFEMEWCMIRYFVRVSETFNS